jgi:hypothetical protein
LPREEENSLEPRREVETETVFTKERNEFQGGKAKENDANATYCEKDFGLAFVPDSKQNGHIMG